MKSYKVLISVIFVLVLSSLVYSNLSGDDQKSKKLKGEKAVPTHESLQFGDIVFQSSTSGQSRAIQLATGSVYSHVGMLFEKDKEWMVLEAVQPVRIIPLSKWRKQGDSEEFKVKRILGADSLLTPLVIDRMRDKGKKWLGKNYDIYFNWSDQEIYCSELVWKIYEDALDLELGELKPLKDFDLSHPEVRRIMKQRYGNEIPENELMISPGDMFDSELLKEVESGF